MARRAGQLAGSEYKCLIPSWRDNIKYEANAFLTIFIAAFTPIPYKLITISAGLFKISIYTLIIASVIGRGMRFFLVSGLLYVFGERIAKAIDKYFDILSLT